MRRDRPLCAPFALCPVRRQGGKRSGGTRKCAKSSVIVTDVRASFGPQPLSSFESRVLRSEQTAMKTAAIILLALLGNAAAYVLAPGKSFKSGIPNLPPKDASKLSVGGLSYRMKVRAKDECAHEGECVCALGWKAWPDDGRTSNRHTTHARLAFLRWPTFGHRWHTPSTVLWPGPQFVVQLPAFIAAKHKFELRRACQL